MVLKPTVFRSRINSQWVFLVRFRKSKRNSTQKNLSGFTIKDSGRSSTNRVLHRTNPWVSVLPQLWAAAASSDALRMATTSKSYRRYYFPSYTSFRFRSSLSPFHNTTTIRVFLQICCCLACVVDTNMRIISLSPSLWLKISNFKLFR